MKELDYSHNPDITRLLHAAGLMTEDIDYSKHVFFGDYEKNELIAIGALENYTKNALIRSVAVSDAHKNKGLGQKLALKIEQWAKDHKIKQLYLLTETASDFFKKVGYDKVHRKEVPGIILATTQFAQFCPETATCMTKKLNDE